MAYVKTGVENSTAIELYYEDHDSGKPVVLLHGWLLSGRSWESQVSALVDAGFRVITYDMRGFGESSKPWTGYDYDTLAADLHTLLEHLGLRDVTLVGFSMGSGEAVRYISRYGTGRIAKAVLAGAVTPYLYKSAEHPEGLLDDNALAGLQAGVRSDRLAFADAFTRTFFNARGQLTVSEQQREFAYRLASCASPKGTLDCITAFGRTDFREDLKKLKVPLLVLHGDSDAIAPFDLSGQRTAAAVPGSRTVLIQGGPHCINASHTAEFNRALIDFLRS